MGIGDTPNSFAYDGNRQFKWHPTQISSVPYGKKWIEGHLHILTANEVR